MPIERKGHTETERAATDAEPESSREPDVLSEETSPDTTDVSIDSDERQARVDTMIDEFRAAQQRKLVKRGVDLWNRAEDAYQAKLRASRVPEKVH